MAVIKYTPKVCDLYKLIIEFKGTRDKEFHKYLKDKLGDEFNIDEYQDIDNNIFNLLLMLN